MGRAHDARPVTQLADEQWNASKLLIIRMGLDGLSAARFDQVERIRDSPGKDEGIHVEQVLYRSDPLGQNFSHHPEDPQAGGFTGPSAIGDLANLPRPSTEFGKPRKVGNVSVGSAKSAQLGARFGLIGQPLDSIQYS